jgi:hypothetical protein
MFCLPIFDDDKDDDSDDDNDDIFLFVFLFNSRFLNLLTTLSLSPSVTMSIFLSNFNSSSSLCFSLLLFHYCNNGYHLLFFCFRCTAIIIIPYNCRHHLLVAKLSVVGSKRIYYFINMHYLSIFYS